MSGDRDAPISRKTSLVSEAIPSSSARIGRPQVFILSDVKLYREGLALSLAQRPEVEVVAACAPSAEALLQIVECGATVVLLDFVTPGALDIPKELNRLLPGIKVIAFAVSEVDNELIACAEAGIFGFVTRDGSVDDLVASILSTVRGEVLCSARLAGLLFQRVAALSGANHEAQQVVLTRREREIAELLGQGLSNKEIARSLRIAAATVKNHVHNILEKLNVTRRGEAAARLRGARYASRNETPVLPSTGHQEIGAAAR
jgi:two-component system, NarL family, nitrate/nitrite response regulator NarL